MRLALMRGIVNIQIALVSIERDLKVLSSEFRPYLHEADAELDKLRERIQHHTLGDQEGNLDRPGPPDPQAPVDPQPADQGSKPPAEGRPDPAH